MMKLRMYQHTFNELVALEQELLQSNNVESPTNPAPLHEYYATVPFVLSLFKCQALYFLGKCSLDEFFKLREFCLNQARLFESSPCASKAEFLPCPMAELFNVIEAPRSQTWLDRADAVLINIANHQIQQRQPLLAIQSLSELVASRPNDCQILYLLFKVHVITNNVEHAKKVHSLISKLSGPDSVYSIFCQGFMAVIKSEWNLALDCFKRAHLLDPSNIAAINNMALCHLYGGDAMEAVNVIESFILSDPFQSASETAIYNICSIYDLISEKTLENRRKVLQLIHDRLPDDFNITVLKLPMQLFSSPSVERKQKQ
ncbi:trafficking protein particle complex subunit 12-like [Schistocerca gregaria]|uniref:trafficking protein particle complex subunit 12-like n=1 Tax=Schistocerca gregaria TaxID=7010 RepID=UPI00211E6D2A|nr:trafficking protein particle complex subunit 12-like [Schistocerca gregaria]